MAWASIRVAPWWRTAVSTSFSDGSGRASAFVVASFMVAYSSASWACGWSCNNPGYAALFTLSSTTFDHSSWSVPGELMHEQLRGGDRLHLVRRRPPAGRLPPQQVPRRDPPLTVKDRGKNGSSAELVSLPRFACTRIA